MKNSRGLSVGLCVLATILMLSPLCRAQPNRFTLDTVCGWGGAVNGFVRVGNYGFCGSGQRLVVLDMSNEAAIHEVTCLHLQGTIACVAVRGDYLYVGIERFSVPVSLYTISISNPANPVITDTKSQVPLIYGTQRIDFYNNLALLIQDNGQVIPATLTDPAHPVVGTAPCRFTRDGTHLTTVLDLAIQGDLAYVGDHSIGGALRIYNLQPDPLNPVLLGSVPPTLNSDQVQSVSVQGTRVLVQGYDDQSACVHYYSALVDVSNPAAPVTIAGSVNTDWNTATRSVYVGNYALVADAGVPGPGNGCPAAKGFTVLDYSNPSAPVLVASYRTNYSAIRDIRVQGNRAYLSDVGQGLVVMDISDPRQPMMIGGYYSPEVLTDCARVGNVMYVADWWNGITALDISNLAVTPAVLGVYRTPETNGQGHGNMVIRNNLAYLAAGYSGVQIVDVSNPSAMTLVSRILQEYLYQAQLVDLEGNVLHVRTPNNYPFLFCNPGRTDLYRNLRNYDVSNAASPFELGHISACPDYPAMISKGGYVYMGQINYQRVDVYDSTNPAAPYALSEFLAGGYDLAIDGNTVVGACRLDSPMTVQGMYILDVTNPAQPQQTGFIPGPGAVAVALQGSRAYVSDGYGARLFDISNPAAPVQLARNPAAHPYKVHIDGNLAYSTTGLPGAVGSQGLLIEQVNCYANCDHSTSAPILNVLDFACFLNKFASGDPYANCDNSTTAPTLNVLDFSCFLNLFASGCN